MSRRCEVVGIRGRERLPAPMRITPVGWVRPVPGRVAHENHGSSIGSLWVVD
jgi:hypothetical protein